MARVTIKVDIPANGDLLATLVDAIIAQDDKLNKATPGSSPIDEDDITQLKAIAAIAGPDRKQALDLQRQAEVLLQQSDRALGIADGQTVRTEGTGLFLVTKIRTNLLSEYKGQENQLELFGYQVVIGSAASPQRTPKAAAQTKTS